MGENEGDSNFLDPEYDVVEISKLESISRLPDLIEHD